MQIDNASPQAYVVRARAYAQLGMNSRALADLDAATKLKTAYRPAALNAVAWCRATDRLQALRDGKAAVEEATKACELVHWKHYSYIDTLAAACAELGDYESAIKHERQVVQTLGDKRASLGGEKQRLELFERHQPYRQE